MAQHRRKKQSWFLTALWGTTNLHHLLFVIDVILVVAALVLGWILL